MSLMKWIGGKECESRREWRLKKPSSVACVSLQRAAIGEWRRRRKRLRMAKGREEGRGGRVMWRAKVEAKPHDYRMMYDVITTTILRNMMWLNLHLLTCAYLDTSN